MKSFRHLTQVFLRFLTLLSICCITLIKCQPSNLQQLLGSGDPDKNLYTHQFIASRGFLAEFHSVVTPDGYYFGLTRIRHPYKETPRGPLVLLGTVGGNAKTWLRNSPGGFVNESTDTVGANLGFELTKRGFDVWLLDPRGNQLYSYNHTKYNADTDLEYWDYSLDEWSFFDIATAFDYVRDFTGHPKVGYIGLALATTNYFFLASRVPRMNHVVQPVILYGPVFSQKNSGYPKLLVATYPLLVQYMKIKRGSDRPQYLLRMAMQQFCNQGLLQVLVCNPLLSVLTNAFYPGGAGSDNEPRLLDFITAVANNLSSWLMAQQFTLSYTDNITMFDVNPETNLKRYGFTTAPEYFPESITNPEMHFFSATSDQTFDPLDLQHFRDRLGVAPRSEYIITVPWSAMSYQDGEAADVIKYVNTPTINILNQYF